MYRDGARVSIAADRDPLTCLRENRGTPADLDRWVRVLRGFKRESVGIDAQSAALSESDLPYFEALWNACTVDERLALAQLAEESVVNPQKRSVVRDLLRSGLIVRNPTLQIVSDRFKDFISQVTNPGQVAIWERQGVAIPWGSIEFAMLTVVATLAGLLIVTQEQLVSAWIGFIPAFLPTAQKLVKAVAALRPPATDGVTA